MGEDCPVFDNLFEFCQIYAGGTIGASITPYVHECEKYVLKVTIVIDYWPPWWVSYFQLGPLGFKYRIVVYIGRYL